MHRLPSPSFLAFDSKHMINVLLKCLTTHLKNPSCTFLHKITTCNEGSFNFYVFFLHWCPWLRTIAMLCQWRREFWFEEVCTVSSWFQQNVCWRDLSTAVNIIIDYMSFHTKVKKILTGVVLFYSSQKNSFKDFCSYIKLVCDKKWFVKKLEFRHLFLKSGNNPQLP